MNKVIICVCSSGVRESLIYSLRSLLSQRATGDYDVSVLLVDNSPDAALKSIAQKYADNNLPLHYSHEPHPGIPFARNAAINTALKLNADWIAYIDDDEIAPEFWISRLLECATANNVDVVVGEVGRLDTLAMAVDAATQHRPSAPVTNLPQVKTAVTSNVLLNTRLIRKPIALRFDENMVFGGSDREFFMRAVQHGASIALAKHEMVFEEWPAHRRKPIYLITRWFRYGVSFNYRYRKNHSAVKGNSLVLLMFLYKLLGSPIKLITAPVRALFDDRPLRKITARSIADIAYAFGCIAPFFGISLYRYY